MEREAGNHQGFCKPSKSTRTRGRKICKATEDFIIHISKTEEGKGLCPSSTEVIGNFCVYFDYVGFILKTSLVSPYCMRNGAQEKGKGQI